MSTDRAENVPEPSAEILNPRQLVDYASHRERLIHWLKTVGKDPAQQEGLAEGTAENYASRLDKFYRRVWERSGGYTTKITHEDADDYIDHLIRDEVRKPNGEAFSGSTKRKESDALTKRFQWRAATFGEEPWDTHIVLLVDAQPR